jgi:hypothetical protein
MINIKVSIYLISKNEFIFSYYFTLNRKYTSSFIKVNKKLLNRFLIIKAIF